MGNVSNIIQFSAIPAPQTNTAASLQTAIRRTRYSNASHSAVARKRNSSISAHADVASCQKLNSSPQIAKARATGKPVLKNSPLSEFPRRFSNCTIRDNKPNDTAATKAENRFNPKDTHPAGNKRNGSVLNQNNGNPTIGLQSHPATLAVSSRLFIVIPWLTVSP